MADETLVLVSRLAFYPVHWRALEEIVSRYAVRAVVFAAPSPALPPVHRQLGTSSPSGDIEVRTVPAVRALARVRWLRRELRRLRPDAIWIQEEPVEPLTLETLAAVAGRRARVATAVCENIFPPVASPLRLLRRALWRRVDALLAVATPSVTGIQRAGMPDRAAPHVLVAGALEPPGDVKPLDVDGLDADDFVVGYAGNLGEHKGWTLLFDALDRLPPAFKLLLAGDGDQRPLLDQRLRDPRFADRAFYVGLLRKDDLWGFYARLDALAVPSLTRPTWMEQFGGVIADAMAMGVPVVGSSSGAIPEVVGDAGVIVPEGDVEALAAALLRLRDDTPLRERLAAAGPPRFEREFAIPAYAARIARALQLRPREVR